MDCSLNLKGDMKMQQMTETKLATNATKVDTSLLGQTYQQILSTIVENSGSNNFQLIYPFMNWWWDIAPTGQIAVEALNFVNSVPAWSAVGTYSPTGRNLFNAYRMVLQAVDPSVSPELAQKIKDQNGRITSAQNQIDKDTAASVTGYNTYCNNLPKGAKKPAYEEWLAKSSWPKKLDADNNALGKELEILSQLIGQESPELTNAMNAITPPEAGASKIGWTTKNQGGNLFPAPWFDVPNGQDWQTLISAGGGFEINLELNQSKGSYDFSKSWAQGSAEVNYGFWEIYVDGSWKNWDINQSDASVTAKIKLTATLVNVTPGEWFDADYLKKLALDNKFLKPYTATGGSSPVFGQNGLLPLQIVQFVAAYQPEYEITMSSSTYHQYNEQYQTAAGFRIGPFTFGGDGGHESNSIQRDSSTTSFKGKSGSLYPFIIGVIVSKPGLD